MNYAVRTHDAMDNRFQIYSSDDLLLTMREVFKELDKPSVYEVHLIIMKEETD